MLFPTYYRFSCNDFTFLYNSVCICKCFPSRDTWTKGLCILKSVDTTSLSFNEFVYSWTWGFISCSMCQNTFPFIKNDCFNLTLQMQDENKQNKILLVSQIYSLKNRYAWVQIGFSSLQLREIARLKPLKTLEGVHSRCPLPCGRHHRSQGWGSNLSKPGYPLWDDDNSLQAPGHRPKCLLGLSNLPEEIKSNEANIPWPFTMFPWK